LDLNKAVRGDKKNEGEKRANDFYAFGLMIVVLRFAKVKLNWAFLSEE